MPEEEFLDAPAGMFPAAPEALLKKAEPHFPRIERKDLRVGSWYYVVLGVIPPEASKHVKIGYLAKCKEVGGSGAKFTATRNAHLIAGTLEADEKPTIELNFKGDELQERVYSALADDQIRKPAQESSEASALLFPLMDWIKADPSVRRSKLNKDTRSSRLSQVARKALSKIGADPSKWPCEEEEIAEICLKFVTEDVETDYTQLKWRNHLVIG